MTESQKTFQISFLGIDRVLVVPCAGKRPTSGHGQPGSLLDMALANGIEIDHACGGVTACSTCHVKVRQGLETCSASTEEEEDQLDKAPGVSSQSRLACQLVPSGEKDLVIEIPDWNRNLVSEGH